MARKHFRRPKTIIVLLKILGIILLLVFPIRTVAVELNIKVDPDVANNTAFDATSIIKSVTSNLDKDFQYNSNKTIDVIVYSRVKFAAALANAPTWVEAAYDGKIHVAIATDQKDFRMITSQIAHEYTHFIVADMTQNNCPRWFNEGLARYEEYKHGMPPHLYLLAIAYNSDVLIPWQEINKQIMSPNAAQSLLAYQQAFSFVYYLVTTYGMPKVITLLKKLRTKPDFDIAIQETYEIPLTSIQLNWRSWLGPFLENWADAPSVVD